jgi:hypothetical protein
MKERIPNPKETTGEFIDPLADLPPGSHGRKVKDPFEGTEATIGVGLNIGGGSQSPPHWEWSVTG